MILVSDEEILEAMRVLGREAAIFVEPAAAAAFAGLVRAHAQGMIDREERVVVLLTGSGLKDVRAAIRAAGSPRYIDPDIAAVPPL